jgi:hypothetical protein
VGDFELCEDVVHRLVAAWGRVRLLAGSTFGSALLLTALPLFSSAPGWAVLLVVSGRCSASGSR